MRKREVYVLASRVNHCGHNAVRDVIDVPKRPHLFAGPGRSAVDFTSVALSNTIDETWTSPLHALFESRTENGVVEAGVHLEERVWKLVKVRDAADDRGEMNYVSASVSCRPGLARRAEVTGADPRTYRASIPVPRADRTLALPRRDHA
jgi:hypothetical protein